MRIKSTTPRPVKGQGVIPDECRNDISDDDGPSPTVVIPVVMVQAKEGMESLDETVHLTAEIGLGIHHDTHPQPLVEPADNAFFCVQLQRSCMEWFFVI